MEGLIFSVFMEDLPTVFFIYKYSYSQSYLKEVKVEPIFKEKENFLSFFYNKASFLVLSVSLLAIQNLREQISGNFLTCAWWR
jgi:hypothetical protein